MLVTVQILRWQLINYALRPFAGKSWEMDIFACSLFADPWEDSSWVMLMHLSMTPVFVALLPWSQSQVLWGPFPQVEALNVGAPDMWSKPFSPEGEAGSWVFPLDWMVLCVEWGLWQECDSAFPAHSDVGIFSVT